MNDKSYNEMSNLKQIQFRAGVWYNPACMDCDKNKDECETCVKREN